MILPYPTQHSSPTVLVIDDQDVNRYAVGRMLQHAGYMVIEASSWSEGEAMLARHPDVIILDVQLPDGNGYDICRRLKADPATASLPVLMTSAAFTKSRDRAQGLDSGADGYLTTPLDSHELAATVRALIRARDAEARLRKSQEMFITLADSVPALVWMANQDRWRYFFNPAWLKFTGVPLEQMTSADPGDYIHPQDVETYSALYDASFAARQSYETIVRILRGDREYRWFLEKGEPHYDLDGDFNGFTGACIDISEQKHLEAELRDAMNKAEAANIAKTDFLANMSHEIRTPMNVIIGLSDILQRTDLTPRQKEFITTLQSSADALLSLINDMLDITKIEDNMLELEQTPFSPVDLLGEVREMMAVRADERGLYLNLNIAPDVPKSVVGDPLRIRQILINLINNAIKFTHRGGVTIQAESWRDAEDGVSDILSIAITDTGVGIPEDKRDQIFEKFTQVDSSITRKYGGSGLGLSIVSALVKQMRGRVSVESRIDEGSTFTLSLPFPPQGDHRNASRIDADSEASDSEAPTILVVEDYGPNILIVTMLLESFGLAYTVASGGAEAVEKYRNGNFAAIMMDVQMQDVDGYEATRQIRELEAIRGCDPMPIIAMTAHALPGDRQKCLACGMSDYLSKPLNSHELRSKLEEIFGPLP